MNETELSVVCKSCGAEVSPYVTECPYCGARLRKRAPELERRDGGLEPKLTRRQRRRREREAARSERRTRAAPGFTVTAAPSLSWAALTVILVPVALLIVRTAAGWAPVEVGALVVPGGGEWWRFLVAPFVYDSIGYLFVVGLTVAIFVPPIERQLGTVATLTLLVACGVLGLLAAFGIGTARDATLVITGGNGIAMGAVAAWYVSARSEARQTGSPADLAGAAVSAVVILLLPLVVDGVAVWAGVAGGLVGGLSAALAVRIRG